MKKTLYIIGGTMGVGKTTACHHLKHLLPQSVFLDGDWCWDASPFQVTTETKAMVLDNIAHLLNNFIHCSAYQNVIFCWVLDHQSLIDSVLSRLDTAECTIISVSLICDKETLRTRLQRDVDSQIRKEDVIERSLARLPLFDVLDTFHIDTNNKSPKTVAEELAALSENS